MTSVSISTLSVGPKLSHFLVWTFWGKIVCLNILSIDPHKLQKHSQKFSRQNMFDKKNLSKPVCVSSGRKKHCKRLDSVFQVLDTVNYIITLYTYIIVSVWITRTAGKVFLFLSLLPPGIPPWEGPSQV